MTGGKQIASLIPAEGLYSKRNTREQVVTRRCEFCDPPPEFLTPKKMEKEYM